jgi:uncharacterized membrane protein
MNVSRIHWNEVLRLAVIVSIIAAMIAVAATAIGDVSQTAIVITVMVIGFVASWVQTSRSTS